MDGHESSTETGFFSSHQRLAFPCVWAAIIHGTGVPALPHTRPPLLEVMKGGCHKRKMVRWSPNDLPVKLPWEENGKLWLIPWMSTGVSTEDKWRPQVKWSGCRPQKEHICKAEGWHLYPLMLAGSEPKEECYHSPNWVMADKAKQKWGGVKWVSHPHVGVKDEVVCLPDVECSYPPRGTHTNCRGVALYPL